VEGVEVRIRAGRLLVIGVEQPRRRPRRAAEQVVSSGRPADYRLEQLAHDPERKRSLKLGSLGLQGRQLSPAGDCPGLAHQLGLADARRALDQEESALARARAVKSSTQGRKLVLALQQRSPGNGRHDPTIHLP
jgi:hypothetical protein